MKRTPRPASQIEMAENLIMPERAVSRQRMSVRAIRLGDRLRIAGLEITDMDRGEVVTTSPLVLRVGNAGFAALFAYGTIVLIGVSRDEEESFLQKLGDRIESRLDAPVIHRIGDRDRNKREDLGRSHHGPGSAAAVSCRRCRRACQECRARL